MAELTLGLDLGPNSIGWALVEDSPGRLVAAGVRVFPEGVERDTKGGEVSKHQQRRLARAMRRQIARRVRRKRQLRQVLVSAGLLPPLALLPADHAERVNWEKQTFQEEDPYSVRRRALVERLEPHALGRALIQLNQRRGFQSNRKTDRARKAETSEMLREISQLEAQMGQRPLGQYLAELRGNDPRQFHSVRIRGLHTRRDMYQREFEAIWAAQREHHPSLLTDELRDKIRRIIFFQRLIRAPSPGLVGRCELEPRLPRCPRADRRAQRFRLFQEVNNLRVIDTSAQTERALTEEERQRLIDYLRSKKERKFDEIRRHLFEQHENIRFKQERGGRTKLYGLPTDAALAKTVGKAWYNLAEDVKDRIGAAIIDDDEERLRYLLNSASLDANLAEKLLDEVNLEDGYHSYSLHALKKLLPYVERGLPLTSQDSSTACALREARYLLPWEAVPNQEQFLPEPPMVTNPLVRQAVHEVRKVVNAVLRELIYKEGHKLARIHIELAREVRGTARQREQYTHDMRQREKLRDEAAERIREAGIKPTRDAIDRYLLWKEQDESCIYSGRMISFAQLFGGEIDIDHILPYPRSLDNSLMNKVVCFRSENSQGINRNAKGDRTPFEWLAQSDATKYEEVLQRARKLPYPKLKRFYQESTELDDFFARQFVDTTYITTQVSQYVRCLGAYVLCPKGQHTAELRHQWGLATILRELGDSPSWDSAAGLPPGEKNRADHRHHAIDAIVIALTDQRRLQQLAGIRRAGGTEVTGEVLPEPWPHFRADVFDTIRSINVSHRPRRKASGKLHDDNPFGRTAVPGVFVKRKPVAELSPNEIDKIRDEAIKRIIVQRLVEHGIEFGRGKKPDAKKWAQALTNVAMPSGVPIRKVSLLVPEKSVVPIRGGSAYVKPGSIHHACIFELTDPTGRTRRIAKYVTLLEAVDRIRRRQSIVQRVHPEYPGARFIMSVCAGDMLLADLDGKEILVVVTTLVSTQERIHIVDATDARPSARRKDVGRTPNSLVARKVSVDSIGRIRWAND